MNKVIMIMMKFLIISVFLSCSHAYASERELPEIFWVEENDEYDYRDYNDPLNNYDEFKAGYDSKDMEETKKILESINDENNKKSYPNGTFKFSIDKETAESMGITSDLMELCIFCNGKDCYKFLLKKDDDYSVKALVKEGKYTIGYLRDCDNKDIEYSLRENSFLLNGGETYENTVAPFIDPYEQYGIKKMTKEELEEAEKEVIENLPELPAKERFKITLGHAYLEGTLQSATLIIIVVFAFLIYAARIKKKSKRPIEFDS